MFYERLLKPIARKVLPYETRQKLRLLGQRLFSYRQYDSSAYWRGRAKEPGQAAVLWTNQRYNQLYRERQRRILKDTLANAGPSPRVLDIGCGIGVVAQMIVDCQPGATVDAVDFPEMIAVARQTPTSPRINYIESSAEEYMREHIQYDVIVSSGCFSAIRDVARMEQALRNAAAMTAPGGTILMIDPFHRWNFLARVKYGSDQVIAFMRRLGFRLVRKSGVLFWPYREWLAGSDLGGKYLATRFAEGERLLAVLGEHFWADYKVLVFRR